jgi:Zn-dependent peptidase ImmA (M78 family)
MDVPKKLEYARNRAGLKLSGVEKLTGIGKSSLSEFENGKREPKLVQLQQLAEVYRRPISFFIDEKPLPVERVLWRERPAESPEDLENRFLKLSMQYRHLEEWCGDVVTPVLPDVTGQPEDISYTDAQELAAKVRKELGLGDRPALQLMRALEEDCGIKVFHLRFEPSGAAASTKDARFGMAILLNLLNARWRRNYDLAHELFHLLVWDVFRPEGPSEGLPEKREEQLADCFASHLLMPDEPVRNAIERRKEGGKLSHESLFEVARQFDVSAEALAWRLHYLYNLGPARSEETRHLAEKLRSLAPVYEHRQWEDNDPPKWPERYKALATKSLRHGEVSLGRFAEFLDMTRRQASEYAEQEDLELEEIQLTPA